MRTCLAALALVLVPACLSASEDGATIASPGPSHPPLGGLGVVITPHGDELAIVRVLAATPACRAGLRAGDVITRIVDGDMLAGPPGARVTLAIRRSGMARTDSITLTRDYLVVRAHDTECSDAPAAAQVLLDVTIDLDGDGHPESVVLSSNDGELGWSPPGSPQSIALARGGVGVVRVRDASWVVALPTHARVELDAIDIARSDLRTSCSSPLKKPTAATSNSRCSRSTERR